MMTCRDVTELVTAYLEKRLPFGDRVRFQMHIGMCKHCRAYVRSMKMTMRTLGKLPEQSPPADVREELLRRFANWKQDGRPPKT